MSVVLLGLGRYVEEITEIVAGISDVVVVEKESERLRNFLEKEKGIKNLSVVLGSATDIELWRREIDLSETEAVISFLTEEATIDVATVLRKAFGYRGKIVYVAKERPDRKEIRNLEIEVVSIPDILGAILRNLLVGKGIIRYPVGIGFRKGEIAEVLITESSPAVYMRLSDLRQRSVRIALIYRENSIILPRTDIRIQPGDRLLVVGDPSRIELFINTVTKGESNFPLKWGSVGVFCDVKGEEFEYLKGGLKVKEWKEECDKPASVDDVGIAVFGKDRWSLFSKSRIDLAFENFYFPTLHLRGSFPYENILVSANTEALGFLLPTAMDFARLFGSKVFIIYVSAIEKMMTKEEREVLENLKSFVDRAQKVSGLEVKLIRKEGNPVRETLKMLGGNFNLLAVGYTPGKKTSLFNPYAPHLLAKRSSVTTLLVPEVSLER